MTRYLTLLTTLLLSTNLAKAQANPDEHSSLIDSIQQVGVRVLVDTPPCNQGIYGAYFNDGSRLVLCRKGDFEERMDTLRHEAWHLIQDLKDCSLSDLYPVVPVFDRSMVPQEEREKIREFYPEERLDAEAEAFFVARIMSARQIQEVLVSEMKYCGIG